jgi:mRNA interferase MazF
MVEPALRLAPGHVVWVELEPVTGREQGDRRPFVVLSGSDYLEIITTLVVGLPVTTVDRAWPNHVRLHGQTGLRNPSWAMTEQPRTLSRSRIHGVSGMVSPATLALARRWVGDLLEIL